MAPSALPRSLALGLELDELEGTRRPHPTAGRLRYSRVADRRQKGCGYDRLFPELDGVVSGDERPPVGL